MPRRTEATEQTRANLRQAFWELYARKPLERISVREITDRAGYNRATFYLHYHDVYELLHEIEDTVLGAVARLVEERLVTEPTPDFSAHMGIILGMAKGFRPYMEVLLDEGGDPSFVRRLKQAIWPLVERFVMPPADEVGGAERDVMREYFLSGLVAAVREGICRDDPMPVDRLIDVIVRVALPSARGDAAAPATTPAPAAATPGPATAPAATPAPATAPAAATTHTPTPTEEP